MVEANIKIVEELERVSKIINTDSDLRKVVYKQGNRLYKE